MIYSNNCITLLDGLRGKELTQFFFLDKQYLEQKFRKKKYATSFIMKCERKKMKGFLPAFGIQIYNPIDVPYQDTTCEFPPGRQAGKMAFGIQIYNPIDILEDRYLARNLCCLLYTSPSPRDRG